MLGLDNCAELLLECLPVCPNNGNIFHRLRYHVLILDAKPVCDQAVSSERVEELDSITRAPRKILVETSEADAIAI